VLLFLLLSNVVRLHTCCKRTYRARKSMRRLSCVYGGRHFAVFCVTCRRSFCTKKFEERKKKQQKNYHVCVIRYEMVQPPPVFPSVSVAILPFIVCISRRWLGDSCTHSGAPLPRGCLCVGTRTSGCVAAPEEEEQKKLLGSSFRFLCVCECACVCLRSSAVFFLFAFANSHLFFLLF